MSFLFYIRLHVHTLAYQAILVERKSRWKNTRLAAVKSSLTANRHVCASNEVRELKILCDQRSLFDKMIYRDRKLCNI